MSPDTRHHRGPHPADPKLFGPDQLRILRQSVNDLCWLLTSGYNITSSLKLVGDRYGLRERQRLAVRRSSCSDQERQRRKDHRISVEQLRNESVVIDGFNLLITIEAALSRGPLLIGVDECVRDLSGVHGSYKAVDETDRALAMIGEVFEVIRPASVLWLLDRPVSNSGRLASRIADVAIQREWPWRVEVVFNPDSRMMSSSDVAITSDASVLDKVERWADLKSYLLAREIHDAWVINLSSV
jgi:hypothetical protein